jgi:rod shape determining protein RodA
MRSRSLLKDIDWLTIILYLLLVGLGWLNIYAAVYNEEHRSILDFSQRYGKQLAWILASFVLVVTIFLIDSKFFSFFAYLIYLLSVLSLVAVLMFGKEIHGARSWFEFGMFNLQPGEFAKIATSLALARLLSSYNFKIHQYRSVLKILLIICLPPALIILQPDMGTALVFAAFIIVIYREGFSVILMVTGILFILLFFASLLVDKLIILLALTGLGLIVYRVFSRQSRQVFKALLILALISAVVYLANYLLIKQLSEYVIAIISLLIAGIVYTAYAYRKRLRSVYLILLVFFVSVAYTFSIDYVFNEVLKEHQRRRVTILLGFEDDPLGVGYNVNQSKIAIGSGGLTGKGFLQGTQTKYDFVPEQSTDFIFCTVGEEWGFLGTCFVIALFIFLLLRLIMLAERQRSDFSRIYGYGVVSVLFFHFAVNIGMTIGLIPVIGIPLPFLSYGGSSLWSFTILLFILIRLDASRMDLIR